MMIELLKYMVIALVYLFVFLAAAGVCWLIVALADYVVCGWRWIAAEHDGKIIR